MMAAASRHGAVRVIDAPGADRQLRADRIVGADAVDNRAAGNHELADLSVGRTSVSAMNDDAADRPVAHLLVTDLDNTLWDWFDIWYESFSRLLDGVSRASGVPVPELEREIRTVH